MTQQLSPAARAVLEAAMNTPEDMPYEHDLAAALRAAASQLSAVQWDGQIPADTTHQLGINWARDALHILANKLEGK